MTKLQDHGILTKSFPVSALCWLVFLLMVLIGAPSWAQTGDLSNIKITPKNNAAGAGTIYTVSFTVEQELKRDGTILLTFPPEFDISSVLVASNVKNLAGGFQVSVENGGFVVVKRDSNGVDLKPDSTGSFNIALVGNPKTSGSYPINVLTQDASANALDSGNATVIINAGPLDHFLLSSNIGNQTAGATFSFTVTGKDAFDNNVAFTDSVALSDTTGTLTPKKVKMNGAILNVNNARITKAQTGAKITATGGGKSGVSNRFNVTPGNLTKFAFSSIASTQEAGVPFPVTMTAQDALGNTVTSFAGTVAITPNGKITPANSGNFSNGTRNENIAYLEAGTGKSITVTTGGGVSSTSPIFAVNAGKPSGTINLTATRQALPADGASKTTITSTLAIKDANGNNVGAGRSFMVKVNNPNFGSATTPVLTDTSSRLSFTFTAGNTGGAATVFVTSNEGSASGSVNISINQLRILAIEATPATVHQGQTNVPVSMTVQNFGVDPVTITSASLAFSSNAADFAITPPIPLPIIPGNSSPRLLAFSVNVKANAQSGKRLIDGRIFGTLPGGAQVSDLSADAKDSIIVQTNPDLSYVAGSLDPDSVNLGAFYEFRLDVINKGDAALALDPAMTTFQFPAVAPIFTTTLDAGGGTVINGLDTTTLVFQSKPISPATPKTTYSPRVILRGTVHGSAYSDTLDLNGALKVLDAPILQIEAITSSQDTVTKGMLKAWDITLHVKNNSSGPVSFKNAILQFFKPGTSDPDTSYRYTILSGGFFSTPLTTLQSGDIVCRITQTGQTTGVMAVFAKVFVNEWNEPSVSNGTQKTILVQTPAKLSIALQASQPTVTEGQLNDWQIIMKVNNDGESDARAIFNSTDPTTRLSKITGYKIKPETEAITFFGKSTTDVKFIVDSTGAAGSNPRRIDGQVYAQEINSGVFYSDDTGDSGSTSIIVQKRATVKIDSVKLIGVFNGNFVNTNQSFQVRAKVTQPVAGAEKVDSVRVRLTATGGNVTIPKATRTLTDLSQGLNFDVTAGGTSGTVQLTASITMAYSANTRANTVTILPNVNPPISLTIQQPGQIQFGPLSTSADTVRFGRTNPPWYIDVPIQNTGGGTLDIQSSQITITIAGTLQNDYIIDAPTGRPLAAGEKDTLKFAVTQTGYTGGAATLRAALNVLDRNSNTTSSKTSGTKAITVESSALVRIRRTDFPVAINRVLTSEIALVDTAQVFDIEVTVENTGLEMVDTAYVSLTHSGNSILLNARAKAVDIATNGGTAKALFKVRAARTANAPDETFIARLDSAITNKGKARATVGSAVDGTAIVRIQLPARLQLNASTDATSNLLTIKQRFTLYAVVKNLGQAETDNSGILRVTVPDTGFKFITPPSAQQSVTVGDTVKWIMRAPLRERQNDNLRVTLSPQPRSKNTNRRLFSPDSVTVLQMKTLNSLLRVDSTLVMAPQGAQDKTVSTEQFFTVEAYVSASEDLINRTATLTLPSGYNLNAGESLTKSVSPEGKANWVVQAPADAAPNPANLQIKASAKDGQSQTQESQTAALAITTQRRALLNLTAGISEPLGAQNGVLSAGQSFTISAILANTGEADLQDTTIVELDRGTTGITVKEPLRRMVIFQPDSQVKTIIWSAVAPNQPSERSAALTFSIRRLPLDENTNKAALAVKNTISFNVSTVARGSLSVANLHISSPPGAQDNELSTGQDFIVTDSLHWTNATQLSAQLLLPPNFSTDNAAQFLVNVPKTGNAILSWRVRASSQAVANATIRVVFSAKDASNDTSALTSAANEIRVNVVNRADPRLRAFISNPPTARDGVISLGQLFEVTAVIENNGQALLSDTAKVSIKVPRLTGYTIPNSQDTIQAATGGRFTWWVQGRSTISEETDLIELALEQAPRDVNTNQPAASTQSAFQLAVRTEGKKLVVENLQSGGGPAFRGEKELLLMRLKLTNPAGVGSSNLALRTLQISLHDRGQKDVVPYTALKAIRVVNAARRDMIYGEMNAITESTASPLTINLAQNVIIAANQPDTIAIFGDIADNATAPNFRLVFDNGQDFIVEDQDGGNFVVVEDNIGKSGVNFRLESNLASLFDAEPEKSFYNYPNPIQPQNRFGTATYFAYNLPEASDGELKIFNLLGEPVWETSFSAADPAGQQGPHKTDLSWDGFNGDGRKVLNGIYVAILKTKFGKATTKVAVAK